MVYNRLAQNDHLANKKTLFANMTQYYRKLKLDPFSVAIPLTYHIASRSDLELTSFIQKFADLALQHQPNVWIIKPGENTNRGCGIEVSNNLKEIKKLIEQNLTTTHSAIVQLYIHRPLLIAGRKFDVRGFGLLTSINGVHKGYFYRDCYFRTSSKPFDLTDLANKYVHLTNDAVQYEAEDYGKFESANKLSIADFQRYLDANHKQLQVCFMRDLMPRMERLVTDSFRAVAGGTKIDPDRLKNSFELFGYDFMVDEDFRVYLIEANTNPSLEICCPLLSRIIPELLDNTFRLTIDPLCQPAFLAVEDNQTTKALIQSRKKMGLLAPIKYSLVFDESLESC